MKTGMLAREAGFRLELTVLNSEGGFYIGTYNNEGPVTRESLEYWTTLEAAQSALKRDAWTQRDTN